MHIYEGILALSRSADIRSLLNTLLEIFLSLVLKLRLSIIPGYLLSILQKIHPYTNNTIIIYNLNIYK